MDTVAKQYEDHDHDHGHKPDHDHKPHHDRKQDEWKDRERYEHYKSHHLRELEKTIKALADSLARLGRGERLHELLAIIRKPGWTSPAELAFVNAILDNIGLQVHLLDRLQDDLVKASRKVTYEYKCDNKYDDKHDDKYGDKHDDKHDDKYGDKCDDKCDDKHDGGYGGGREGGHDRGTHDD